LARQGKRITYGDLGKAMYPTSPRISGGVLAGMLGSILHWTRQHDLPILTSLVIDEATGLPGEGCGIASSDVPVEWQRVFAYDWHAIEPPTEDELQISDRGEGVRQIA
jgi:hypothetical protein